MKRANQPTLTPADGSTGFVAEHVQTAPSLHWQPEQQPTWAAVNEIARTLRRCFVTDRPYSWAKTMTDLANKVGGIARSKAVDPAKVAAVAELSERLAYQLAADDDGYLNYAVNPEGLAELVNGVTSIQSMVRDLAGEAAPGALCRAIDALYSRSPNGRRAPAEDPFEGALIGREAINAAWDRGRAEHLTSQ